MLKRAIGFLGRHLLPAAFYSIACRSYDRLYPLVFILTSFGGKRECPLCRIRVRGFIADDGAVSPLFAKERIVGGGPFEDAVCPWCGSFERERQVFLYLRDQTHLLSSNLRVLHFAPEGRLQRILKRVPRLRYMSIDLISPKAAVKADI